MENVKPAPDLTEEIRNKYIPNEFLYYKKRNRYIDVLCSHCGRSYVVDTYSDTEDMLYDDADKIRHNSVAGKCRLCHVKAVYKAKGKAQNPYSVYDTVLYGRKYKGNVAIWVLNISKTFTNSEKAEVTQNSKALVIFEKGKMPTSYIKEWDYQGGRYVVSHSIKFGKIPDGKFVHPTVWRAINNSYLKYFAIRELSGKMETYRRNMYNDKQEDNTRILKACAKCSLYPEVEYLTKLGKEKIAIGILEDRVCPNRKKKTPWDRLGIYKERLKDVENIEQLEFFREEREKRLHYSTEDARILSKMSSWDRSISSDILKYASIKRQDKYMSKQKATYSIWRDYLMMKEEAGYQMDDIDIFPKDLDAAHDRMVWERNKEKTNKRMKDMNVKFKKISTIYKKESSKYEFEENGLMIRMAKDAGEIVKEGATLHHCVGASDTYFDRHSKKQSYIMFIRKKSNRPYITVEFSPKDLTVAQWYGIHDSKPDRKVIEAFLKSYVDHLREKDKRCQAC